MNNIGSLNKQAKKCQTIFENPAYEVSNPINPYGGIEEMNKASLDSEVCLFYLNSDDNNNDDNGPIFTGKRALIPEGEYNAKCIDREIESFDTTRKLRKDMEICDGPYEGTILPEYYNYPRKMKPSSKYCHEWCIANGGEPIRNDRMPPKVFDGKVCKVKVKTCRTDEGDEYSIVEKILCLLS